MLKKRALSLQMLNLLPRWSAIRVRHVSPQNERTWKVATKKAIIFYHS